MKRKSLLSGILYGCISMIILPLLVMYINEVMGLPRIEGVVPEIAGIVLLFVGVTLLVIATKQFKKFGGGGSPLPFDPPHKLVTQGVYTYSRNPMFVASAMIWFGEFLFFGSILLLPYAIAWVLFNHLHLIVHDEKWLEKRFGNAYIHYKKRTAQYIPGVI